MAYKCIDCDFMTPEKATNNNGTPCIAFKCRYYNTYLEFIRSGVGVYPSNDADCEIKRLKTLEVNNG